MSSGGYLYPSDADTQEPLPAYRIEMPGGAATDFGAAFVGTGNGSYAVIGYAVGFGPVVEVVQKLKPLPRLSN